MGVSVCGFGAGMKKHRAHWMPADPLFPRAEYSRRDVKDTAVLLIESGPEGAGGAGTGSGADGAVAGGALAPGPADFVLRKQDRGVRLRAVNSEQWTVNSGRKRECSVYKVTKQGEMFAYRVAKSRKCSPIGL